MTVPMQMDMSVTMVRLAIASVATAVRAGVHQPGDRTIRPAGTGAHSVRPLVGDCMDVPVLPEGDPAGGDQEQLACGTGRLRLDSETIDLITFRCGRQSFDSMTSLPGA
jgi:hypothetical protein